MQKERLRFFLIDFVIFFLCIGGIILYFGLFISSPTESKNQSETVEEEIPELRLYLHNTTLEEINSNGKDVKYPGNMARFIINDNNYDFNNVEIKGHGNSTWNGSDKKPYQIKFDTKQNLFDIGKSKTWILLPNYFDDSYIKNDLAFYISNLLNMTYTNNGKFINLYIENEYIGLYYLTQKVSITNASVKLRNIYGVLIELDNFHADAEAKSYRSENGDLFVVKDSVSDDEEKIELGAQDFIKSYNCLQSAILNSDWATVESLIDVDSFARYYIVQTFTLNWDSFVTSNFFYKDGVDDKIHAGPIWDYDNSFGDFYSSLNSRRSLQASGVETKLQSAIFFDLMELPEFKKKVTEIVNSELLPNSDEIINYAKKTTENIRNAAMQDGEKWGKNDFDTASSSLIERLQKRFEYFHIYYENAESFETNNYLIKELNEVYNIERLEDNSYKISRVSDGKVLSLSTGYLEYGETIFENWNDNVFERWYISRNEDGGYYLFSKATESVLTLENGILKTEPLQKTDDERFEIAEIGVFPLDTFGIEKE